MSLEGRDANGNVTHPHLAPNYTYDGEPEAPKRQANEPQTEAVVSPDPGFESMTVPQLRALALERGIHGLEKAKKADVIAALG